ncbi:hypothetical protein JTE90_020825 [Oedothorax gibbosus]|uniref:Phage protein n=1 Tax=Oedothorax gibbosus TaxID=931172 RepID=A0AAV6U6B4_9ARAC|nr:hypothetical protein JTE90_020825 [Oedothorax gibbosus]
MPKVKTKISRLFTKSRHQEVERIDSGELKQSKIIEKNRRLLKKRQEGFANRNYDKLNKTNGCWYYISNAANKVIPELKKNKRENE